MPFYKVTDNVDTIYAEDINQFSDALSGNNDVGQIKLFTPISPPGAPTVAVNPTAGNLTGNYKYAVAFVTGYWKGPVGTGTLQIQGNTGGGTPSASVSPSSQQVNITNIPTGPTGTVARILYRTKANGSTFYFLTQINDNTTTAYIDNTPDGSLGAQMPTVNTTGTSLNVGGTTIDPYGNVTIPSGKTLTVNGNFLGAYASNADVTGSISDLNGNAFAVAIAAPSGTTVDPFGITTGGGSNAVKAFSVSRTNVVASKNNILEDGSGNATFAGNVNIGGTTKISNTLGSDSAYVQYNYNAAIPANTNFKNTGGVQWQINGSNMVTNALYASTDGSGNIINPILEWWGYPLGGGVFLMNLKTGALSGFRNTFDDGSGNATFAGNLTVNGSLTVNGGGVMKPRTFRVVNFSTNQTTPQTVLNITGKGEITGVWITPTNNQSASISITIDGTTVLSNSNMTYTSSWCLSPDGRIAQISTGGVSTAYAGAQFNQSVVITANTNGSGGNVNVIVGYAIEQ
ncbi:hypothetical protein DNHGIG_07930 [Collibacillus ludicampi]|uniref:Uncharacterized protein n=1 Tax=Collibacillus ludicampi TaxID=2771369 RepID=A0AAV4LC53_9BACL|nr:hypothetical protein [Collibacillus ludicampi]GIM45244.1 hypothetical protein DNHGIG_07930 [Collibacillus ludicampi]